eukprot:gene6671-4780_t
MLCLPLLLLSFGRIPTVQRSNGGILSFIYSVHNNPLHPYTLISHVTSHLPPYATPRKNPLLATIIAYQSRGVGRDMALKSILGIFRLLMHYSKSKEDKEMYFHIVDSIIECRMLGNFGKPGITLYQGMKKFKSHNGPSCSLCEKLVFLSSLFRTLEQLSGDLGFLQKVMIHQWSRQKLSFCYRFFKSFSLTIALAAEVLHHNNLQYQMKCRGECTAGSQCRAGKCGASLQRDLLVSRSLIVRTLCDMYVYFKWLPFYTPNTTAEYICGSISGMIGVWLVWKDDRYPNGYTPPCQCGGGSRTLRK